MMVLMGIRTMSTAAEAVFSSVAAPLGNIDELRIIDIGGTGRGLQQLSSIVPDTVFKFLAGLQARGIDVKALLSKLGVDIDEVLLTLGQKPGTAAGATNEEKEE